MPFLTRFKNVYRDFKNVYRDFKEAKNEEIAYLNKRVEILETENKFLEKDNAFLRGQIDFYSQLIQSPPHPMQNLQTITPMFPNPICTPYNSLKPYSEETRQYPNEPRVFSRDIFKRD